MVNPYFGHIRFINNPCTNKLAPLTLYKYKKRNLGRHRGALVALEMHCESRGMIFNDNQPRDLAWRAPLIRRQSDDVLLNRLLSTSLEKHEGIFYEWNGLLRDFGRPQVMNDTWSKMEAIQSRLDCGIWWFRLENIADLKTTFCGD